VIGLDRLFAVLTPLGSNLLINNKGELKLADFGLARLFADNGSNYTNNVVTLWYRAPELLLGATTYDFAVDMWSAGCILAELLARKPILPGKREAEQITLIYQLCGSPNDTDWPEARKLQHWETLQPRTQYKRRVREQFKECVSHTATNITTAAATTTTARVTDIVLVRVIDSMNMQLTWSTSCYHSIRKSA
jgi:serine/threonine protein kinase